LITDSGLSIAKDQNQIGKEVRILSNSVLEEAVKGEPVQEEHVPAAHDEDGDNPVIDDDYRTATMSRWPPWIGKRCVKVKRTEHDVRVMDSKLGEESPILVFTHAEWEAFIHGVKHGEFDLSNSQAEPVSA